MKPISNIRRRRILQALGLGAGSLMFPSLLPRSSKASGDGAPKRLAIIMTYGGMVHPNWRIRPQGQSEDEQFSFSLSSLAEEEFSRTLRPLYEHRSQTIVFDGLDMLTSKNNDREVNESGIAHFYGELAGLTGNVWQGHQRGARSLGLSIDQIVANHIAEPNQIKSLELSTRDDLGQGVSCHQPGSALPRELSPVALWNRLFANYEPPKSGPPTLNQRVQQAQPSVLDMVGEEYSQLSARMSLEDRRKLDDHAQMVRELEQRIEGFQPLSCEVPEEVEEQGSPLQTAKLMLDLVAAAFACGVTPVATLVIPGIANSDYTNSAGDDHDWAHDSVYKWNDAGPVHEIKNAEFAEFRTLKEEKESEMIAEFCAKLAATSEAGGSMLDNTLVMWVNEMGNGTHEVSNWPCVMVGGGSLGLNVGQYHRWPLSGPPIAYEHASNNWRPAGMAHNRVLTGVAQAFGVDTDIVGLDTAPLANGVYQIEHAPPPGMF